MDDKKEGCASKSRTKSPELPSFDQGNLKKLKNNKENFPPWREKELSVRQEKKAPTHHCKKISEKKRI